MCGIVGKIDFQQFIDSVRAAAALEAIRHRGPDGSGALLSRLGADSVAVSYADGKIPEHDGANLFLGHRRLSIIDLSTTAAQPMTNEDRTVWIVFNGEIYNYAALRRSLIKHGHRFVTDHSDTEVLIHGYEQWGQAVLNHINGMFAFAIVDLKRQRLFLARDRFGEKPLYYRCDDEMVCFASELKAILALGASSRQIDDQAVSAYLGYGYVPAPMSIFKDVKKLSAAHCIEIDLTRPNQAVPRRYWQLDYSRKMARPDQWNEAFEAALVEAIDSRTISDVPLGAFLSGGLDSTMVVRGMRQRIKGEIKAFTIGFKEAGFDESPYARAAADRYQLSQFHEVLDEQEMLKTLPNVFHHFDEPFADSSAIPTFLVSRLARAKVTVSLSGDAGDELLMGYPRYRWINFGHAVLGMVPQLLHRQVIDRVIDHWPESIRGKGIARFFHTRPYFSYLQALWDPYFVGEAVDPGNHLNLVGTQKLNVESMCHVDTQIYLPEDLMVKVDRASMAVSLESRAPFLDHRLFEVAAQMPIPAKFDGRHGKLPFRRALTRDLGRDFVERPKKGFSVPIGHWFRNELYTEMNDTLLANNGTLSRWVDPGVISSLIHTHCTGTRNHGGRLWRLFALYQWMERYGRETATGSPLVGMRRPGS